MAGFEVLKKLADGCAAEAFLARQQDSAQRVVLEILRPDLPVELSKRFVQEARALLSLAHPDLIRRAHIGQTADKRPFAVSEPLEGETLTETLWSHGSLKPQDVMRLAIPLCEALDYLHQTGTVHGSLSPDNVYLPGGLAAFRPKLLDLRLALLGGGGADPIAGVPPKPAYLSPESLTGQVVDARADIYAMGVLLYESLTGFPPFAGATPQEVLSKQRRGIPPLPASCEELAPIVQRCLRLERSERYGSAMELSQELTRELEAVTPASGSPTLRATRDAGKKRLAAPAASRRSLARLHRRGRAAGFAALALIVLAAVGAGWVSHKKPMMAGREPAIVRRAPSSSPVLKSVNDETSSAAGTDEVRLRVTSEPPGALVVWARSGEALGRTPLVASVPRQQDEPTVRIELPGYRPVSRKINLDADASAHAKLKSAAAPARKKALRRQPPTD
ncbi:MAG TPA: serine/threonine-protein kinase [Myxococcaceae bacterium]|nr:serine/threonine-protein kinase [Myxococcaceae bacterium]